MRYGVLTIMQSFKVVSEAATLGAEAHVGPSDISTKDYERMVEQALATVEGALRYPDMVLRHGDGTPYMLVGEYLGASNTGKEPS